MKKIVFIAFLVSLGTLLNAQNLKIAVAAGYKKPVSEVLKAYEAQYGLVDAMYGNMTQIFAHAKHEDVALVIGDKKFLNKQKELSFKGYQTLGLGKAVVIYAKGISLANVEDIASSSVKSVAIPEPKKAIYGDVAIEFLTNAKLYETMKERLVVVATVPHVATYVGTHEVDAGVVNLTEALSLGDKIGGFIEIPSTLYTPIEIVSGTLDACLENKACASLGTFFSSSEAKAIFAKYGL